jgi:hypothetical protein
MLFNEILLLCILTRQRDTMLEFSDFVSSAKPELLLLYIEK